jgi:hypothetical protein
MSKEEIIKSFEILSVEAYKSGYQSAIVDVLRVMASNKDNPDYKLKDLAEAVFKLKPRELAFDENGNILKND